MKLGVRDRGRTDRRPAGELRLQCGASDRVGGCGRPAAVWRTRVFRLAPALALFTLSSFPIQGCSGKAERLGRARAEAAPTPAVAAAADVGNSPGTAQGMTAGLSDARRADPGSAKPGADESDVRLGTAGGEGGGNGAKVAGTGRLTNNHPVAPERSGRSDEGGGSGSEPALVTAAGDPIPLAPMGHPIGHSPLEKSPGYHPPEDPESLSVVTGRRRVAVHDKRFTGGESSAEELAAAILEALRTENKAALMEMRVDFQEFDQILWPEFPQSRPATHLESKDAWFFLDRTSAAGMNDALSTWGGRDLRLERVTYDVGLARYTNFNLYHGVRIHAYDPSGRTYELTFADSFTERKGRWKVYTYKD